MTKIHIISDLFLRFNEHDPSQEILPDVDIVIINGNIGHPKRSMLYAETLCKKYPDVKFIYNLGESELYHLPPKYAGELEESMRIRRSANSTWPSNLHWPETSEIITCRTGESYDVLCTYGFPKIHSIEGEWANSRWARYYIKEILDDIDPTGKWYKPDETSTVRHGHVFDFATMDWINEKHEIERLRVKKWELVPNHKKILVTHLNPYKDSRITNQITSPYLIHLHKGLWVSADQTTKGINFLGSSLHAYPGRNRDNVVIM